MNLRIATLLLLCLSASMCAVLYRHTEAPEEQETIVDAAAIETVESPVADVPAAEDLVDGVPGGEEAVAAEHVAEPDVQTEDVPEAAVPATEEPSDEKVAEEPPADEPAVAEESEMNTDAIMGDVPAADEPVAADVPEPEVPEAIASEVDIPAAADIPEAEAPEADVPEAVALESDIPVAADDLAADVPASDAEADVPIAEVPEAVVPIVEVPEVPEPDVPEVVVPEEDVPLAEVLESDVSEPDVPAEPDVPDTDTPAAEAKLDAEDVTDEELADMMQALEEMDHAFGTSNNEEEESSWGFGSIRNGFQALNGYFNSLVEMVGGKDGVCQYRCKDGETPQPRPDFQMPEPDGCTNSLMGFQVYDTIDLGIPAMTKCCDQLDMCYDTCGTSKYRCDSKFRWCMHGICSDLKKSLGFVSKVQACESMADVLYKTVSTLGCNPYMNSQRAACYCTEETRDEL